MNREMRRLMEREERRQKKQEEASGGKRRNPAAAAARAPQVERKPWWQRLRTYLHEVRQELKRVSWPTRDQMVVFTAITLITTTVLTVVVFGLDVAMKEVVMFVITGS